MSAASNSGSPIGPFSTASAPRHASSVSGGSGVRDDRIAAAPNGCSSSSTSGASRSSTRRASATTSGPMPSPGRSTIRIGPLYSGPAAKICEIGTSACVFGARFRDSVDREGGGLIPTLGGGAGPSPHPIESRLLQFRRIDQLPPYAFAEVDRIKLELRRAGEDVIDLGFGNPDVASPDIAVAKLQEAAAKPRNHRYSASRGIPRLRAAICDLYRRKFGVELDPETQAITTIGAKEGLAHLMWVLVQPGDTVVVPTPSYPIHRYAPVLTGARVADFDVTADDPIGAIREAVEREQPRVLVLSYPHNPTTVDVEPGFFDDVVALARERELLVVHDFAYADLAFDGYEPPSILQVPGAADCC